VATRPRGRGETPMIVDALCGTKTSSEEIVVEKAKEHVINLIIVPLRCASAPSPGNPAPRMEMLPLIKLMRGIGLLMIERSKYSSLAFAKPWKLSTLTASSV